MEEILDRFMEGLLATTLLEYIAVFSGILSVWYSRKAHILVYPIGLINTIIYVWLSFKADLLGEASVNFYYTVMNVYGWVMWTRKDQQQQKLLSITFSDQRWWKMQILFFAFFYVSIFFSLQYLKQSFAAGAIPWADAFASATAFTGMWLMTRKKVESWIWWIATNIASIPLYFTKGYVVTSLYYIILLGMAVAGWVEWRRRALNEQQVN
ncbi:MAG: nicotinamide mononucleotide transporter [Bacteroidetes bacterium]|nr:nicotinamide mononucleotide transporter [Bacteroidota bacterium]